MESSNILGSQSIKNISVKLDTYPAHHRYLQHLFQAEGLLIEDECRINYDSSADSQQYKTFRQPAEIILEDENSQLSQVSAELSKFGLNSSTSRYIFKLLASFTIKNNKRFRGSTELQVNKLFEVAESDLPWVDTILRSYEIPSASIENILKTVIRCSLTNYRNNFFDLVLEEWSCWDRLDGTFTSAPYICSRDKRTLDIFARDSNKNLLYGSKKGPEWSGWTSTRGPIASAPCAAHLSDNSIHIFARGENNSLLHLEGTGYENYGPWKDLGGSIISSPSQCLCENGELHIFGRGEENELLHIVRSPLGQWSKWESLGGDLTSAASAVTWGNNRIDVFARGKNNTLWSISLSMGQWGPWTDLGGSITSAPSASSRTTNRIDIFARGTENQLLWKIWNGANWSQWLDLGGYMTSSPSSVSSGADSIDVLARGYGGNLIYICNK